MIRGDLKVIHIRPGAVKDKTLIFGYSLDELSEQR